MIQITQLTKVFDEIKALDDVSITFTEGAVYGLVGSNGSGKSTLMRLISGVYTPDSGDIALDAANIFDNPSAKEQIFFLSDNPYFIHQSNLTEMASFYKMMYPNFSEERFQSLSGIFPIDSHTRISSMSKGMQRQAALILALSTCPKYLLLDEAFDGLDPVIRQVLKGLLSEGMATRNMTTIIASHNLRELEDLCDQICLLHQGKLLLNDDIDVLKSNIYKIQIAFENVPDHTAFEPLHVMNISRTGSLLQMIVRGDYQNIMAFLQDLNPLFAEAIPLSLEELFIYEMEVTGYDIKTIIQ